jgi:hypothetical protein
MDDVFACDLGREWTGMCGEGGARAPMLAGRKVCWSVFVGLFYLCTRSLLTHAYLLTVKVMSVPGMCQCLWVSFTSVLGFF